MSIIYRLFKIFLGTVLLITSCSPGRDESDWVSLDSNKVIDLSMEENLSEEILWETDWEGRKIISFNYGDLLGDRAGEFLLAAENEISLMDLSGRVVGSCPLQKGERVARLIDYDRDGKEDIILHRPHGPLASLRIINGKGHELLNVKIKYQFTSFRTSSLEYFQDEMTEGDLIFYIRVNGDSAISPRGFIKYLPLEDRVDWFFRTPFEPIQLYRDMTQEKLTFLPGMTTSDTNMFLGWGVTTAMDGINEADYSFARIYPDGTASEPSFPDLTGTLPLKGNIKYLKTLMGEGDWEYLLLHESNYHEEPAFRLFLIDQFGNLIYMGPFISGLFKGLYTDDSPRKEKLFLLNYKTRTGNEKIQPLSIISDKIIWTDSSFPAPALIIRMAPYLVDLPGNQLMFTAETAANGYLFLRKASEIRLLRAYDNRITLSDHSLND